MSPKPKRHVSPTLDITITDEDLASARASNSGGCLIADGIKRAYPNLTHVTVDMATIRVSDREKGVRFIYLTPAEAQHVLLAFDQGWPNPTNSLTVRRAVQVVPIVRHKFGPNSTKARDQARKQKIAVLVLKQRTEGLTADEQRSLTQLQNEKTTERPSARGAADVKVTKEVGGAVVYGGQPLPQGPSHPNLLRGRDRHFGARLADPGKAFTDAVEAEIARRKGTDS
jgi:hypothetical protein